MSKIARSFMFVFVAMSFLLAACGSATPAEPVTVVQTQLVEVTSTPEAEPVVPATGSIAINGAGATFPLPIYTEWTYAYEYVDPSVTINYQGVGSGGGKKAIVDGTVDFAGSDSAVTAAEYTAGKDLQMYPVLAGSVVFIYNLEGVKEGDPALVLDRETLVGIYNGTVKTWNDPKIA